LLVYKDLNKLM